MSLVETALDNVVVQEGSVEQALFLWTGSASAADGTVEVAYAAYPEDPDTFAPASWQVEQVGSVAVVHVSAPVDGTLDPGRYRVFLRSGDTVKLAPNRLVVEGDTTPVV